MLLCFDDDRECVSEYPIDFSSPDTLIESNKNKSYKTNPFSVHGSLHGHDRLPLLCNIC